jgi:AraC family transcriptional regulator of adaptative response / DNA-3-methyladenine glycosylase II
MLDDDTAYLALKARDARFDGRFFVGVSSTGVYCRPICRVRLPLRTNCNFYALAAQAEAAGYRPCLRCRPELAPGPGLRWSQMDASNTLAHQAADLLQTDADLARVAQRLGVTDRHLRRIFTQAFGLAPMQYLQTQRLLLAKGLLTDTQLKITDIAGASGFQSVRRFNAAFNARYRLSPSQLRKAAPTGPGHGDDTAFALKLAWRAPFNADAFMRFLQRHDVPGLEHTEQTAQGWRHRRRLGLAGHRGAPIVGWVEARPVVTDGPTGAGHWHLRLAPALLPHLHRLPGMLRRWLDTDTDPSAMADGLAGMPGLDMDQLRGTRVPGVPSAEAGYELAIRTIIGQQVSLKAAITLTRRLVQAFGRPVEPGEDGPGELAWHFPEPRVLAHASAEQLGRLGLVRQRVAAVQALSREVCEGRLSFDERQDARSWTRQLTGLPGIGPWTASYLAMRVLREPDVFLSTDVALLIQLARQTGQPARPTPAQATRMAQAWAPWRSYAVMALWNQYLESAA